MSAPTDANTTEADWRTHWPCLLAGLAAATVAVLRTALGQAVDLPLIERALAGDPAFTLVRINWYALSGVFAVCALALFAAPWLTAPARRAIASLATAVFGVTAVVFMALTWAQFGSPFAEFPWLPLSATTALCAFAAWRA